METENILELFYKDKTPQYESLEDFITLYEKHKNKIESSKKLYSDTLTFEYAICLAKNEEYKKAIPFLDSSIKLLNSNINKHILIDTESYLKQLTFMKGKSMYFTRNLKEAKLIFSKLHQQYPNNDIYQGWLKSSITYRYEQINKLVWGAVGLFLILYYAFVFFEISQFKYTFLLLSFLSVLTSITIRLVIYFEKKKIK